MSDNVKTSKWEFSQGIERNIIFTIALIFIVWSAVFIYRSSFIAIDGKRYFCLFDDAMISMRYAWNFSHGAGLVWNAGDRVMGYTNLLMTLLMSASTLLLDKSSAVLSIQVFGLALMLAIAYAAMKITASMLPADQSEQYPYSLLRILSFTLALLYYPLNYWTLMGMETGLLTVLLLFAVFFAIQYTKNRRFYYLLLVSLCLGLAFMARNDSILFAVLIWIYILWKTIRDRTSLSLFYILSVLFVYSLFVIGQCLFQYLYYGDLLPNTYILKLTGMPLIERISNGLHFVLPFAIQTGVLFVICIGTVLLAFSVEKLLLLGLSLGALSYQIYVGGDPWNYWRMLSPVMPLVSILFLLGIFEIISSRAAAGNGGRRFFFLKFSPDIRAGLLIFMGVMVANAYFLPEIGFLERPFYVPANQHNVNTALALEQVTTLDASEGVFWAGAIPYFAGRKGIDFLGKSDRYIARLAPDLSGAVSAHGIESLPGHNKYDLYYSIGKLKPTFVQDFKWGVQDLSSLAETDYVKADYKGIVLYLLKNSPEVRWDKLNVQ